MSILVFSPVESPITPRSARLDIPNLVQGTQWGQVFTLALFHCLPLPALTFLAFSPYLRHKATGRSKSFYVREAIAEYLQDREDYLLGIARLEEGGKRFTLEEVAKKLGQDR